MWFFDQISRLATRFSRFTAKNELTSVVLLRNQPFALTQAILECAAAEALGRPIQRQLNEYAVIAEKGGSQVGFVSLDGLLILANNFGKSYFLESDLPKFIRETKEMRTRKILRETAAWSSFDLMNPSPPNKKISTGFYRVACRMTVAMLNENCIGIYLPQFDLLRPVDTSLKEDLLADEPIDALKEWDPVVVLQQSRHEEINEAMASARARWAEFEEAFRSRKPGQYFLVKRQFQAEGSEAEWMWVEVRAIDGGIAEGQLVNDPVHVRGLKRGDDVRVSVSEIGDWAFNEGDEMRGGFVETVLRKRMNE